jgi:hypothetical protein
MLKGFRFEDGGRTYTCEPVALLGPEGGQWWCFTVSSDTNRYAPFRAESRDTRSSIQERIVAYYTNHLKRRAEPDQQHWAKRGRPPANKPQVPGAAAPARPQLTLPAPRGKGAAHPTPAAHAQPAARPEPAKPAGAKAAKAKARPDAAARRKGASRPKPAKRAARPAARHSSRPAAKRSPRHKAKHGPRPAAKRSARPKGKRPAPSGRRHR